MDASFDASALFAELCVRLHVEPDRHGEAHTACPFPGCGKEVASDARSGHVHFSFSERGGHCFVCGQSASLPRLAQLFGLARDYAPMPRVAPLPRPGARCATDFNALCRAYEAHPGCAQAWRQYKPLWPETIKAYRLGYGSFPPYTSRCRHPRLMVPLIAGGRVVGFRGRRTPACSCDAKAKWLSPSGTRTLLYNGERLGVAGPTLGYAAPRPRAPMLFVVENPLDALLIEQCYPDIAAVATLSVSNWRPEWTEAVKQYGAEVVTVAFDNDLPGNGGAAQRPRLASQWRATHHGMEPPRANGVKLVNRLLQEGVTACLFEWPEDAPDKADIGDLLAAGEEVA